MIPNIVIFGKSLAPWYMLCALAGILFTLFFSYFLAKKHGYNEVTIFLALLVAGAASLIGSHLLYGLTNIQYIIKVFNDLEKIDSFETAVKIFTSIFGGSVYYGGLITGIIGGWLYIRRAEKVDRTPYYDMGAVAIPLFHVFGRIGCFLGGCCYGVECSFGFTYHYNPIEIANGVPRFPVQLVEAALNLALFFLLLTLFRKNRAKGKLLYLYLLIYPVYRFILEFFRGDAYRGFLFGLSTSQLISIVLFAIALIVLIIKRKKEQAPPAEES